MSKVIILSDFNDSSKIDKRKLEYALQKEYPNDEVSVENAIALDLNLKKDLVSFIIESYWKVTDYLDEYVDYEVRKDITLMCIEALEKNPDREIDDNLIFCMVTDYVNKNKGE